VDYIKIPRFKKKYLSSLAFGLARGAKLAGISISGGETSIHDYGTEVDLVGTAIGVVDVKKVNVGFDVKENDVVIGFASSGVHANGFTFIRHEVLESSEFVNKDMRDALKTYVPELGRTLGEALLEPTRIYSPMVVEILERHIPVQGFMHITGDSFDNLKRLYNKEVKYCLDLESFPKPLIFEYISKISKRSMWELEREHLNIGIGFCIIVRGMENFERVTRVSSELEIQSYLLGYVRDI